MDAFVSKGKVKEEQQTINSMIKKRESVIRDICRMIFGKALSFNLVKCPFQASNKTLKPIGEYGRGLKSPSFMRQG